MFRVRPTAPRCSAWKRCSLWGCLGPLCHGSRICFCAFPWLVHCNLASASQPTNTYLYYRFPRLWLHSPLDPFRFNVPLTYFLLPALAHLGSTYLSVRPPSSGQAHRIRYMGDQVNGNNLNLVESQVRSTLEGHLYFLGPTEGKQTR